jgi:hypothetical protein
VLDAEYEGIMILQNIGHYPPDTASHPGKLGSPFHEFFAKKHDIHKSLLLDPVLS